MQKKFNVTAVCIPDLHYMVKLDKRLEEIKILIDTGKYFTINCARQYGKTTTLLALKKYLQNDYYIISMDFQAFGSEQFKNETIFAKSFARTFLRILKKNSLSNICIEAIEQLNNDIKEYGDDFMLQILFENLSNICDKADKSIILIIDEVDSATNNQVFLDFLSQLRFYYIQRTTQATFQSVILSSVYDIKNLKRKLEPNENPKENSPWNIASDFTIDMSLSKDGIADMLMEYEMDYHTGMNIEKIASLLYDYTSGYPFLVSRLCQLLDENSSIQKKFGSKQAIWTEHGFMEANRILTTEKNTLFESIIGKIIQYPELSDILQDKIFNGQTIVYTATNSIIDLATMFGIIKNVDGVVVPANKIFAKVLSDYFLSLSEVKKSDLYKTSLQNKNQFITNGKLNMKSILEKFMIHFNDLYGQEGERFLEEKARKYLLLYLRPIINGTGHYSMEAVTSSNTRTDLIVYYNEDFFIIEMKIWKGNKMHKEAEQQLLGYMKDYHINEGYLVTFNFNKTKKSGIKEVKIANKILIETFI